MSGFEQLDTKAPNMHARPTTLRWLTWSLIALACVCVATAYELRRRQQRLDMEEGRRFPFLAYENGQVLIREDGGPLRFPTREAAHRYEREYADPSGKVE